MVVKLQRCTDCLTEKKLEEFYNSCSPFHSGTGKLHVCKECIFKRVINKDTGEVDLDVVKDTLRQIDKPFLMDTWISSLAEAENRGGNVFRLYMKNIAMRHYKDFTYADSRFGIEKELSEQEETIVAEEVTEITFTKQKLKEMNKVWGKQSHEDYQFLEDFYNEYDTIFPTENPVTKNLYRNIAKTHLSANKELEAGRVTSYEKLMNVSSKLHTDANIKPVQSSGLHDDNGNTTYGLWIKDVENDEPCEHFESKPVYEDFDGFRRYWDKWFIRPFKNIFRISKDFDVDLNEDQNTPPKDDEEDDE